jgi:hypothetical protein
VAKSNRRQVLAGRSGRNRGFFLFFSFLTLQTNAPKKVLQIEINRGKGQ